MTGPGLSLDPLRSLQGRSAGRQVASLLDRGRALVVGAAFWTAVLLPGVYLPLLSVAGVDATIALLAVHAAALVVGHDYRRRS